MANESFRTVNPRVATDYRDRLVMLIATGGYAGNCSVVPATVGSFVGLVLYLPFANGSPIIHIAVIIAMLASFILSRTLVPTMAKYLMKTHHAAAV